MKKVFASSVVAGLLSCSISGNRPHYDYPHYITDSLEVSGTIWHMGASGGLLFVLFRDSLGSWKLGFYDALNFSEIAMASPGHDNLDFSDALMGTGELYISFASAHADTNYIVIADIPGHSINREFAVTGATDWGPIAAGPGAIYHMGRDAGILYALNLSTGEVTETQSDITPATVGGMLHVGGHGLFLTDGSGNTLYLVKTDGTRLNSWGVDLSPTRIAWDGYRVLVTAGPGLCPVSPNTGKLPTLILSEARAVSVTPDTELILVGYRDGVASVSVNGLEFLGNALTPFAINLVAPAGQARAFASARGKSKVYLLEP